MYLNLSLRPNHARRPRRPFWLLRLEQVSGEPPGLVIGGLLLAQVLVVALYMVLSHHLAQAQNKRQLLEQQAELRHRCGVLAQRLERQQCLLTLSLNQAGE